MPGRPRRGRRGGRKHSETHENARIPPEATLDREQRAWELRLDGLTYRAIADELAVEASTAHTLVRRVEARVLAELSANVAAVKARQTLQLERIYAEAMAAWGRSKDPVGEPKFLTAAMAALKQVREVWGLDRPSGAAAAVAPLAPELAEEILARSLQAVAEHQARQRRALPPPGPGDDDAP